MNKKLNYLMPSMAEMIFITLFLILSFSNGVKLETGHVRVGTYILDTLSIPKFDVFSYTYPPVPIPMTDWLAEVIMALLNKAFGLSGVFIFFTFLISLTYYLLFKWMRQYEGNILVDVLIILLVIASSKLHFSARPHVFSLLFFVISYYILDNFQHNNRNYLYFLPPIMLFWINLHGAFIMGFILIGVYLLYNIVMPFVSQGPGKKGYGKKANVMGLLILACIFISFINPNGYKALIYPFQLVSNNFLIDNVPEFLSPNFHHLIVMPFNYLLLLLIMTIAVTGRRLRFTELLLILLFLNMALYSVRNILFFSIVAGPILSRNCKFIFSSGGGRFVNFLNKRSENISKIDVPAKGYIWTMPLVLLIAVVLSFKLEYKINPEENPVAAVEFLKRECLKGNMFGNDKFCDYMIYSAYPQYKVFMHGKFDMYSEKKARDYFKIALHEYGWESAIEKYKINWIIFDTNSVLSSFLKERNDWKMIYTDKIASIFVRNVSENFDIIKKYRQPLSPVN